MYEYGIKFTTVLIRDIKVDRELVADHQWFRLNQGFEGLDLEEGDTVIFNANVSAYIKGYLGKDKQLRKERSVQVDYQLTDLTNVSVLKKQECEDLCLSR